jgi:hypothetical protein
MIYFSALWLAVAAGVVVSGLVRRAVSRRSGAGFDVSVRADVSVILIRYGLYGMVLAGVLLATMLLR